MRLHIGKWYLAFQLGNFAMGLGYPSMEIRAQIDLTKPHWPKSAFSKAQNDSMASLDD